MICVMGSLTPHSKNYTYGFELAKLCNIKSLLACRWNYDESMCSGIKLIRKQLPEMHGNIYQHKVQMGSHQGSSAPAQFVPATASVLVFIAQMMFKKLL
jgi:hypothetical protein